MPQDPKYVRLSDRMSGQHVTDIAGGSGWSISGGDVKPFPKREAQQRFVRQRLAANVLEPSSKAEFDEVQRNNAKIAQVAADHPGDEAKLQDLVESVRADPSSSAAAASEPDGGDPGD